MRKFSVAFFLSLFLASHSYASDFTSLAEAKAQAAKLNKPLLIDFMTGW